MNPTDEERLRVALRSWDPVPRTSESRTGAALDDVRRGLRGGPLRHPRFPLRWAAAATAAAALVLVALYLTSRIGTEESVTEATASRRERPVQLTMVASNGVRVYWTIETEPSQVSDGRAR